MPPTAETILIVDDLVIIVDLVAKMLAAHFNVLKAYTAREALAYPPDQPIDLLIADILMPHMTGPVLAELMITARPNLKVLIMTGAAISPNEYLGPTWYAIAKPFTGQTLLRNVRAIFANCQ